MVKLGMVKTRCRSTMQALWLMSLMASLMMSPMAAATDSLSVRSLDAERGQQGHYATYQSKAAVSATGRWWVVLEGAPSLEFEGGSLRPMQAGSGQANSIQSNRISARYFAPTSPTVTGRRFDPYAAEVLAYVDALDEHRKQVLTQAQRTLGRAVQPHVVLHHISNAFSAVMTPEEAQRLAALDGVVSVKPVEVYAVQTDRTPPLIGAPSVWDGSWNAWAPSSNLPRARGEGVVIGIIDSGINVDHRVFSDSQAQGATHTYTNPYGQLLGECSKPSISCNNKLVGVYDFTTEGTSGRDPAADGHGTHVASTAAGNPWNNFSLHNLSGTFSITGMAPNAHIISYKVCYNKHPTDSDLDNRCVGDAIRRAFEQAILNEVDVINYSIGGDASDPWRSGNVPRLSLNFWANNIAFVTSAGNSGPDPDSITQPANAPWVVAVGNSTHDRRVTNTVDVGTRTRVPAALGSGPSLSSNISAQARRVDSVSPGNLLACEPLPSDALVGEIAVIERGDCLFADKVRHARQAGAVAVIMVNQQPGEAIIMGGLEDSLIPAVMIARDIGQSVFADLNSGPLPATLFADRDVVTSVDFQDNLAASSSRGPMSQPRDIMKPDLVAPGSNILAAHVPNDNSLQFLSGTSMASPHVAGAIALLRQLHPNWGVDALMSAVVTTADHDKIRVDGRLATSDERGGGRLRVDRAASAGLYLPITAQQFEAANPALGGVPRDLNLPGMVNSGCGEGCVFTRRVRAHQAGTWTVTVEGDVPVTVSPSQFSLQAGQEQVLTIQVTPRPNRGQVAQTAQVVLTPQVSTTPIAGQVRMVPQRLMVSVASGITDLPGGFLFTTSSNRGSAQIELQAVEPVDELRFVSSPLVLPVQEVFDLPQHVNRGDPFDGAAGTTVRFIDVPAGTMALYAATLASTADDIDLFVGFSPSGADVVSESNLVCESISPDELERCLIPQPQPGRWWIVVQNWQASAAGAEDEVVLAYTTVSASNDPSLTVAGPGRHPGGALSVDVSIDQPLLAPEQQWFGVLELKVVDGPSLGVVPLLFERDEWTSPVTTVLFPDEPYSLRLQAGRTHDRMFVDVPPSTTELRVTVQGDADVRGSLRRVDFDQVLATQPVTPIASGPDLVSGEGSSAGFSLVQATPTPGRYYVVLNNQAGDDRAVTVTAELTEAKAQAPRRGLWDPEGEVINQGVEYQTLDGVPFITWYSYDGEGLPMFYLGAAASRPGSAIWVSPLDRYSSGGTTNINALVGRVSMTAIDEDRAVFSWRLRGAHGSWLMQPSVPEACVQEGDELRSYTGHWHSPDLAQGGATTIMMPQAQFHVRYYYDSAGIGRWVVLAGDGAGPQDEILDVLEFRGFCPNCSSVVPDSEVIGEYFRDFSSEATGEERLEFVSRPPLNQAFVTQVPIERLSDRLACP